MVITTLEKKIKEEISDYDPADVIELVLDGCSAPHLGPMKAFNFANVAKLSLVDVQLQTLQGMPEFPELVSLDVSDNKLSGGLEHLIEAAPQLQHLGLGGNTQISSINQLKPLTSLPNLRSLDLVACGFGENEEYEDLVYDLLPDLVYLNALDREGNEKPESDDEEEDEEGEEGEAVYEEEVAEGEEVYEGEEEEEVEGEGDELPEGEVEEEVEEEEEEEAEEGDEAEAGEEGEEEVEVVYEEVEEEEEGDEGEYGLEYLQQPNIPEETAEAEEYAPEEEDAEELEEVEEEEDEEEEDAAPPAKRSKTE